MNWLQLIAQLLTYLQKSLRISGLFPIAALLNNIGQPGLALRLLELDAGLKPGDYYNREQLARLFGDTPRPPK